MVISIDYHHHNGNVIMNEKIGFSNVEVIIGFSDNCFVRKEGRCLNGTPFIVNSRASFMYCNAEASNLAGFSSCVIPR